MEQVVEPVSAPERRLAADPGRRVAPGGWKRATVGVALGIMAGALVALVVPRDAALRPVRRVGGRLLPREG